MSDLDTLRRKSISRGKFIIVDEAFGNDSTGARQDPLKPFATVSAALAAATSGDTLFVLPGDYIIDNLTLKDGVNMNLEVGARFLPRSDYAEAGDGMFTDGGVAVTCTISGYGDILCPGDGDIISAILAVSGEGSNIIVQCRLLGLETGGYGQIVQSGVQSVLSLLCRQLGVAGGIATSNGTLDATARRAVTPFTCSGTGEQRIYVDYFDAGQCTCTGGNQFIHTEVTYARTLCSGGFQSVSAAQINLPGGGTNPSLECSGGVQSVSCGTVSASVALGDAALAVLVSGGEMILRANKIVQRHDDTYAVEVTGGLLRLNNATVLGKGNKAPLHKTGGTAILSGCALVADTATESIKSDTAQNVICYGCFANIAKDGNTTIVAGTLTVHASVQ